MKALESEKQLSVAFEDVIRKKNWTPYYPPFTKILKEMDCLQGRPDFVGSFNDSTFIPMDLKDRLASALRTPSLAQILSLLHYAAPRSRKYLLRKSGLSIPVTRRSIKILESHELVKQDGKSGYLLPSSFPKMRWELWAFEVKVDHWKRALYQALQYRAFANRVSVVLPERWIHRIEQNINRFRLLNVGVIALDADKRLIRFIVRPKKSSPSSRFHYFYALGKFLHEQCKSC